jgi:hypothetical protein
VDCYEECCTSTVGCVRTYVNSNDWNNLNNDKGDRMKDQAKFIICVSRLIQYAYGLGYTMTGGDLWATSGHKKNSLHYDRLAIDLNLFRVDEETQEDEYLKKTEDHTEIGIYWESLDPKCRWGGRYGDGNHYELVPGGYKR